MNEIAIVTDKNNTHYIGIYNFYNSFCYYISAIQRLHSSLTIKELLKGDLFNNDNREESKEIHRISKQIFEILTVYNKIDDLVNNSSSDDVKISNNLRGAALKKFMVKKEKIDNKFSEDIGLLFDEIKKYEKIIDEIISEKLKHGGDPQEILIKLFLPILFNYTDNTTFLKILKELNFNILHFKNTNYGENQFELTNNKNYNATLLKWYREILSFKDKVIETVDEKMFNNQFCVSTLCIFFSSVYERDYSSHSGHAVTFILGSDDLFYVIDDSNNIMQFENYIKMFKSRIYEMEIKDLTSDVIQKLSENDDLNVDNRIYRTVIKFKEDSVKSMIGGDLSPQTSEYNIDNSNANIIDKFKTFYYANIKWFKIYYLVLVLLVVILIIHIILYYRKQHLIGDYKVKIKRIKNKVEKMRHIDINSIEVKSNELMNKIDDKKKTFSFNSMSINRPFIF